MKHMPTTMTIAMAAMLPTVLAAQSSTTTTTSTTTSATTSATTSTTMAATKSADVRGSARGSLQASVPASFSAEGKKSLRALYTDAGARGFSASSMANLVAEGQAKGASEATILKAATAKHAQLVATHEAMVRAGRSEPTHEEIDRGANVMARGASAAQIETIVRKAPAERSLTVAFEVLTDLTAKGVPVNKALAQVQTKLEQRASDASLRELGVNVGLGLGAQTRAGGATSTGAANGATTGTSRGLGATVGGTVSGTVGGVIRKP